MGYTQTAYATPPTPPPTIYHKQSTAFEAQALMYQSDAYVAPSPTYTSFSYVTPAPTYPITIYTPLG